jgi:hypothetical protein
VQEPDPIGVDHVLLAISGNLDDPPLSHEDLDRFTRDMEESARLLKRMAFNSIEVHAATGGRVGKIVGARSTGRSLTTVGGRKVFSQGRSVAEAATRR